MAGESSATLSTVLPGLDGDTDARVLVGAVGLIIIIFFFVHVIAPPVAQGVDQGIARRIHSGVRIRLADIGVFHHPQQLGEFGSGGEIIPAADQRDHSSHGAQNTGQQRDETGGEHPVIAGGAGEETVQFFVQFFHLRAPVDEIFPAAGKKCRARCDLLRSAVPCRMVPDDQASEARV